MLLVLDSNEYILSFGAERKRSSEDLLKKISASPDQYMVRLPRTTVEDTRKRLSSEAFREFLRFLRLLDIWVDEDELVPYEFGGKYLALATCPNL